jgi:hypothetical protein
MFDYIFMAQAKDPEKFRRLDILMKLLSSIFNRIGTKAFRLSIKIVISKD